MTNNWKLTLNKITLEIESGSAQEYKYQYIISGGGGENFHLLLQNLILRSVRGSRVLHQSAKKPQNPAICKLLEMISDFVF